MSKVKSVSKSQSHHFSKQAVGLIHLVEGQGVDGDAHKGNTVKHRSRVKVDPTQPNLRQVHLIHYELLSELMKQGFHVAPGSMGENITTVGVDLLGLPTGAILQIGNAAEIKVTGLRNPCGQIEDFEKGLLSAVLGRDNNGKLIRKTGVMGIVLSSGEVRAGDEITTILPAKPHKSLAPV